MNILGKIDTLEVGLANTEDEIRESQRLRFKVFYEEMSAKPNIENARTKLDADHFDAHCDHLLVVDRNYTTAHNSGIDDNTVSDTGRIIGSSRLLPQSKIGKTNGFYSNSEFDIDALLGRHPTLKFLEFGRSCVLPEHRNKRSIELLWQGSWAYVRQHKIDVMFGCASFNETDPDKITEALSFLYHFAGADTAWQVEANDAHRVNMNRMDSDVINKRSALHQLPPLIKGYLRLGAKIAPQAVIDHDFGTIDVLIMLPVEFLNPRYVNHYGSNAERYSPKP